MSLPTLDQYLEEMVTACTAYTKGDDQPFYQHCRKYSITAPTEPIVLKATVYKIITGNPRFPMEMRTMAKRWLLEMKLSAFDDGDVPV